MENAPLSPKDKEEIRKLQLENRSIKLKNRLEVIKTVVLVLGSVLLFWVVQRPESLLNRKQSQESISRERAKLVLDLLKTDDVTKIKVGLSVIQASYPEGNEEWFRKLDDAFAFEVSNTQSKIQKLNEKLQKIETKIDTISTLMNYELSGRKTEGSTGFRGAGPAYAQLKIRYDELRYEREVTQRKLDDAFAELEIQKAILNNFNCEWNSDTNE